MTWFWFALAAPAVWGIVNHLDKFVIEKYFTGKGVGFFVIFTGLSGFLISVFVFIFNFDSIIIAPWAAIVIAITGAIFVASYIPYMHAIEKEETSCVVPFYQMIPVFSYFLALIFLGEKLSLQQIIGSVLIVGGAMLISLNVTTFHFKWRTFFLMMLSSLMTAITFLIFKFIAVEENFWGTVFWDYIGGAIFALLLFFFIPLYRKQLIFTINKNKGAVLILNFSAEILNIIGRMLANFATLLVPVALVLVVNGFQPIIVLIYGIILTVFIPKWGKENIEKNFLIQKIVAILIIFSGAYVLFT